MSLSLDHSPINSGGQTSQSLRWPHPVSIFRQLISELAERNSTTIDHMLGSKCNLKTHVRNLGYQLPLQIGGPKTPFWADFAT